MRFRYGSGSLCTQAGSAGGREAGAVQHLALVTRRQEGAGWVLARRVLLDLLGSDSPMISRTGSIVSTTVVLSWASTWLYFGAWSSQKRGAHLRE